VAAGSRVDLEQPVVEHGGEDHTPVRHSSQFKNNHSTEMCSGSEAGSYLTLVSLSLRLKDLLGPVTRVKKKKKVPGRP